MSEKDRNPFARAVPFVAAWCGVLWCAMVVVAVVAQATMSFGPAMDISFKGMGVLMVAGLVPLVLCVIGVVLYGATRGR